MIYYSLITIVSYGRISYPKPKKKRPFIAATKENILFAHTIYRCRASEIQHLIIFSSTSHTKTKLEKII